MATREDMLRSAHQARETDGVRMDGSPPRSMLVEGGTVNLRRRLLGLGLFFVQRAQAQNDILALLPGQALVSAVRQRFHTMRTVQGIEHVTGMKI
jgi:hypothetical protein